MSHSLVVFLYFLNAFSIYVSAGPCFSTSRDPDDPVPVPGSYALCRSRPANNGEWAPKGGWACDDSKVDFPTVDCLIADMKVIQIEF